MIEGIDGGKPEADVGSLREGSSGLSSSYSTMPSKSNVANPCFPRSMYSPSHETTKTMTRLNLLNVVSVSKKVLDSKACMMA